MGVIARQSIKRGILNYIGSLIGVFSLLFVYPLSKESYGFVQFLISSATIFSVILSLGSTSLVIRFYPDLKVKFKNSFLGIIISIALTAIIIMSMIVMIFYGDFLELISRLNFQVDAINQNSTIIYILTFLVIFIQIFIFQASNFQRIVVTFAIHDIAFKLFLPLLILGIYFDIIAKEKLGLFLILFYIFSFFANALYLKIIKALSISKNNFIDLGKTKIKEIANYMGFSSLNIIGESITTQIDRVLIPLILTMSSNGIYSIFLFMSNTISIPVNSLFTITAPVIADSIKNNDFVNVEKLYKKTSLNSFLAGSLLFVVLWTNIYDIVKLMPNPKTIDPFVNVFLFLGLGKLVDMLTSVNTHIIVYSRYYRYNLFFILTLAIMNIVFSYYLINKYGITGAALGSFIALIVYNVFKLVFIKIKFDITPFTFHTFTVLLINMIVFLIGMYLPETKAVLISILYKSTVVVVMFYVLLKIFKVDSELISYFEKNVRKMINFISIKIKE
jgi:O-antigen/teichoic acid export membrane protein